MTSYFFIMTRLKSLNEVMAKLHSKSPKRDSIIIHVREQVRNVMKADKEADRQKRMASFNSSQKEEKESNIKELFKSYVPGTTAYYNRQETQLQNKLVKTAKQIKKTSRKLGTFYPAAGEQVNSFYQRTNSCSYGGLFRSFVPGTKAFRARLEAASTLAKTESKVDRLINLSQDLSSTKDKLKEIEAKKTLRAR